MTYQEAVDELCEKVAHEKENPGKATVQVTLDDLRVLLRGALAISISNHFAEFFVNDLSEVRSRLKPILIEAETRLRQDKTATRSP